MVYRLNKLESIMCEEDGVIIMTVQVFWGTIFETTHLIFIISFMPERVPIKKYRIHLP